MEEKPDYSKKLSENVKQIMKEKDITQKQLALALDTSQGNVSLALNNNGKTHRAFTVSQLVPLSECLHVSIDFLLGVEEKKQGLTVREIAEMLVRIDEALPFGYAVEKLKKEEDKNAPNAFANQTLGEETLKLWLEKTEPIDDDYAGISARCSGNEDYFSLAINSEFADFAKFLINNFLIKYFKQKELRYDLGDDDFKRCVDVLLDGISDDARYYSDLYDDSPIECYNADFSFLDGELQDNDEMNELMDDLIDVVITEAKASREVK